MCENSQTNLLLSCNMSKKLMFVLKTEILGLFVGQAKANSGRIWSFGTENIFLHPDIIFPLCLKEYFKNEVH